MSQVIENGSVVTLDVESAPAVREDGWSMCDVRVTEAHEVTGLPELLGAALPRALTALVPPALADRFTIGARLRAEASLAGPGILRVARVDDVPHAPDAAVDDQAVEDQAVEEPTVDD